jgi:hypothetical protein
VTLPSTPTEQEAKGYFSNGVIDRKTQDGVLDMFGGM